MAASDVACVTEGCQRCASHQGQVSVEYLSRVYDLGWHDSLDITGFDVGGILRVDHGCAKRKGGRGPECLAMHLKDWTIVQMLGGDGERMSSTSGFALVNESGGMIERWRQESKCRCSVS